MNQLHNRQDQRDSLISSFMMILYAALVQSPSLLAALASLLLNSFPPTFEERGQSEVKLCLPVGFPSALRYTLTTGLLSEWALFVRLKWIGFEVVNLMIR